MVIIGQKTLTENLGIDVKAQLKASVLKAQRRHDGAGMELTARSVGESNDGTVLRAAMAITVFVPSGDAPGEVDDEVAPTLPSQPLMIFQDSEVEMLNRVGGACWRRLSITLFTITPRRNVQRCCAISFLAGASTCYVGRCRVTHMHARSPWQFGFIRGQWYFGLSRHLNVIACGGVRQSRAPTTAR